MLDPVCSATSSHSVFKNMIARFCRFHVVQARQLSDDGSNLGESPSTSKTLFSKINGVFHSIDPQ